jgi:hypothetical protein
MSVVYNIADWLGAALMRASSLIYDRLPDDETRLACRLLIPVADGLHSAGVKLYLVRP